MRIRHSLPVLLLLASCTVSGFERIDLASLNLETAGRPTVLPVRAGTALRVHNLAGQVELRPAAGAEVTVEAQVHCDRPELLEGMRWVEREDGEGNTVWTLDYPTERFDRFHYPLEGSSRTQSTYLGREVVVTSRKDDDTPTLFADLVIGVPAGAELTFVTLLGEVDAQDVSGSLDVAIGAGHIFVGKISGPALDARTGSGAIEIREASVGATGLETGSGAIVANGLEGERLVARTGSGDIEIEGARLARVQATTGSGSVSLREGHCGVQELRTGSGSILVSADLAGAERVDAATGSGSIRVSAGDAAQFTVTAKRGSGSFSVGYGDAVLRHEGKRLVGATRGDGSTEIELRTGSGSCSVGP